MFWIIVAITVFCGVKRANRKMREARDGSNRNTRGVVWDENKHTQHIFYGDWD